LPPVLCDEERIPARPFRSARPISANPVVSPTAITVHRYLESPTVSQPGPASPRHLRGT